MLIRRSPVPLDDDQLARATQMNRVYVNAVCRQLAEDNLIIRGRGATGKIVNAANSRPEPHHATQASGSPSRVPNAPREPRQRPAARLADRVDRLTAGFPDYVAAFEASQAFPGPSLYFHLRAINRRREHHPAASLLEDSLFLEYVYAVLPAWGMHRMGPQAAKVGDFIQITTCPEGQRPGAGRAVVAAYH